MQGITSGISVSELRSFKPTKSLTRKNLLGSLYTRAKASILETARLAQMRLALKTGLWHSERVVAEIGHKMLYLNDRMVDLWGSPVLGLSNGGRTVDGEQQWLNDLSAPDGAVPIAEKIETLKSFVSTGSGDIPATFDHLKDRTVVEPVFRALMIHPNPAVQAAANAAWSAVEPQLAPAVSTSKRTAPLPPPPPPPPPLSTPKQIAAMLLQSTQAALLRKIQDVTNPINSSATDTATKAWVAAVVDPVLDETPMKTHSITSVISALATRLLTAELAPKAPVLTAEDEAADKFISDLALLITTGDLPETERQISIVAPDTLHLARARNGEVGAALIDIFTQLRKTEKELLAARQAATTPQTRPALNLNPTATATHTISVPSDRLPVEYKYAMYPEVDYQIILGADVRLPDLAALKLRRQDIETSLGSIGLAIVAISSSGQAINARLQQVDGIIGDLNQTHQEIIGELERALQRGLAFLTAVSRIETDIAARIKAVSNEEKLPDESRSVYAQRLLEQDDARKSLKQEKSRRLGEVERSFEQALHTFGRIERYLNIRHLINNIDTEAIMNDYFRGRVEMANSLQRQVLSESLRSVTWGTGTGLEGTTENIKLTERKAALEKEREELRLHLQKLDGHQQILLNQLEGLKENASRLRRRITDDLDPVMREIPGEVAFPKI